MVKPLWTPLNLSILPDCTFIACDPSLTALGIVLLDIEDDRVSVLGAEKLSTVPTSDRKGWEDTFYRAEVMEALIAALLDCWQEDLEVIDMAAAVHEAPPVAGKSLMRTEASILTSYAFRSVVLENDYPLEKTVSPQAHKKLISGNHLASKQEHHAELKKLFPRIEGSEMITNEATRDALSIGLYAAWRLGQTNG